jgi:hypothetical protein
MLIVVDAQRFEDRLLFTTYDYTFRFHVVLRTKLAKLFLLLSMCFFLTISTGLLLDAPLSNHVFSMLVTRKYDSL